MTIGLVIGAVLVQETPLGAAYFLDPKVIASFAMWCVYVLLLVSQAPHGVARPQGRLSLRRRSGRSALRLGRKPLRRA